MARQTFWGLRAHVRVCWPVVIADFRLTPANLHELCVAEDLFEEVQGFALGDRNYWNPQLKERSQAQALYWLTPYKWKSRERQPWPKWLNYKRYRIDTVFSQLVERYHVKRVWARDTWHFYSRWLRKILSHSMAILFCQQVGLSPLHFSKLLTD